MAERGRCKDGREKSKGTRAGVHVVTKSHKKMIVWHSIDELDIIVQDILCNVPRNEFKMRSQIDNASASVGANFVEGYYGGFLPEYIRFLTYSRRSLGELQERVRRVLRKGYINELKYSEFDERACKTMYLLNRLIYSLEKKRGDKCKSGGEKSDCTMPFISLHAFSVICPLVPFIILGALSCHELP
jgi:four helix bundle protein